MEKLNSYPSASDFDETRRAIQAFRSAREVFQDMDDGEPWSMSQVLWLVSLGLTSEELITSPMVSLVSLRRMKRCRCLLQ